METVLNCLKRFSLKKEAKLELEQDKDEERIIDNTSIRISFDVDESKMPVEDYYISAVESFIRDQGLVNITYDDDLIRLIAYVMKKTEDYLRKQTIENRRSTKEIKHHDVIKAVEKTFTPAMGKLANGEGIKMVFLHSTGRLMTGPKPSNLEEVKIVKEEKSDEKQQKAKIVKKKEADKKPRKTKSAKVTSKSKLSGKGKRTQKRSSVKITKRVKRSKSPTKPRRITKKKRVASSPIKLHKKSAITKRKTTRAKATIVKKTPVSTKVTKEKSKISKRKMVSPKIKRIVKAKSRVSPKTKSVTKEKSRDSEGIKTSPKMEESVKLEKFNTIFKNKFYSSGKKPAKVKAIKRKRMPLKTKGKEAKRKKSVKKVPSARKETQKRNTRKTDVKKIEASPESSQEQIEEAYNAFDISNELIQCGKGFGVRFDDEALALLSDHLLQISKQIAQNAKSTDSPTLTHMDIQLATQKLFPPGIFEFALINGSEALKPGETA